MHSSIKLDSPIEFVNVKSISPLVSKCQIKVCYVGEQPNRNGSIITKEVATKMANSLPGSPIVGFFDKENNDFKGHEMDIEIVDGKLTFVETTKPYGFVDLNAKVWFQKFLDDNKDEREYLMTEGYLWTGQYPECERILTNGNNQSMGLDKKSVQGSWTKKDKKTPQFFIINEAIISKLCILGEDVEPCFEGATISKVQFSFEDNFKTELFTMIKELTEFLEKGGMKKVFDIYEVKIGDNTWNAIYEYLVENYADPNVEFCSIYSIEGVYVEGENTFAVLANENKFYRLDFSVENDEFKFAASLNELEDYVPAENQQFAAEEVSTYVANFIQNKQAKDPEPIKCPICGGEHTEEECLAKHPKYSLEEVVEYQELLNQFNELNTKFEALQNEHTVLQAEKDLLQEQNTSLTNFKLKIEKKQKEEMIAQFFMLSDEDKEDVIKNIDTYSLDEIEAKLSVICVRNKVNLNIDSEANGSSNPTTYSLQDDIDDNCVPAWVKAASAVAKNLK